MSISSVTSDTTQSSSSWRTTIHEARQDFNALFQAMANNDLSGAQQAYTAIQQLQSSVLSTQAAASTATTGVATTDPLAAVKTDWSSLGRALQSGSLTDAQQAFSQLGQDALAVQQARYQQVAASTSTLQSDIQSLDQALKAGDTTSAQKLLSQLEQDLRNSRLGWGQAAYTRPAAVAGGENATSGTTATA
jgi:hypothetical protein